MKNFVSIKDVKLNDMKKKELVKVNGGFLPFDFLGGMTGMSAPYDFTGDDLFRFFLGK